MACHTVHYDTTALGRLVPFVSVSIVMLLGRRRSERNKAAREKAMKESEEGAVRDSDAEDASEDSDGPGPDPGRVHVPWVLPSRSLFAACGRIYVYVPEELGVMLSAPRSTEIGNTYMYVLAWGRACPVGPGFFTSLPRGWQRGTVARFCARLYALPHAHTFNTPIAEHGRGPIERQQRRSRRYDGLGSRCESL